MNHFHFIDVKPTIDRTQTASIKDAIFRRAKEKSNALAEEKSENYTAQVQDDVMNMARNSLKVSPKNPFSLGELTVKKVQDTPKEQPAQVPEPKPEEQNVRIVKRNIESASNNTFVNSVKEETMNAARNQFRQGTNLNTILNFLNTQAAIKMAENSHSKIRKTG